ncbi:MAG: hypothetical protein VXZ72_01080 [Chlamydiota bacterium]|nr:hypothetical protein [Chlamydiota bacterium]
MWILPKQLHISAFVADTKALDLDSEEFSQICEKSLTWRGKDSLSRTWLQRWKRENWMQHLCSRTLRPSHTERFKDAWTFSLEVSRANPSVLLESVKQLKTQDTSSPTSQTESENANLELFSLKTYKGSSPARQETESQFSNMSSESWKEWVIEQRQEYSQRKKSAHLTRESESSSLGWPTPATRDYKGANSVQHVLGETASKRGHMGQLPNAVLKDGLLDQANPNKSGKSQESWGTPRTSAAMSATITENLVNRNVGNLEEQQGRQSIGGKLNPDWVEHLMGLPVGWTDLGSWETE